MGLPFGIGWLPILRRRRCGRSACREGNALKFHEKTPTDKPRPLWQRLRSPSTGPGLESWFFADAPGVFHRLPERHRLQTVRTFLGPAGEWFAKEKAIGKVPLILGFFSVHAEIFNNRVSLRLQCGRRNRPKDLA
jgi:hypothetical protein